MSDSSSLQSCSLQRLIRICWFCPTRPSGLFLKHLCHTCKPGFCDLTVLWTHFLPKQIIFSTHSFSLTPNKRQFASAPTSLRCQTIITASSAKRRRRHRKSRSFVASSHRFTQRGQDNVTTTSDTAPLCLWHILATLSPSCSQLAGGDAELWNVWLVEDVVSVFYWSQIKSHWKSTQPALDKTWKLHVSIHVH